MDVLHRLMSTVETTQGHVEVGMRFFLHTSIIKIEKFQYFSGGR